MYFSFLTIFSSFQLSQKHIQQIDDHMQKVFKAYMGRPWPVNTAQKRRISTENNLTRCGADCTCSKYAECQQNAAAYISAAEYTKDHQETIDHGFKPDKSIKRQTKCCHNKHRCGATDANHRVCLLNESLRYSFMPYFVKSGCFP